MYVGTLKKSPLSRTPRRLIIAMATMIATPSSTRNSNSAGTIDVMAATPAATETATVST